MVRQHIVIVGAGHAGAQAAIALRLRHFAGRITLIGAEPDYPYERPPLSKDYLAGDHPFEKIRLRPPEFWNFRQIDLRLGEAVSRVLHEAREVEFQSGERLSYGKLIWACGGAPRKLACQGADLQGVHSIRTRADVDKLRAELDAISRVAIIGAGYIGLEVAAVLRKLGKDVVIFEAESRVLARVAGAPISSFYEKEHRSRGVDVRTGVTVQCLEGKDGRVTGVNLATGETVAADLAIVGIGIVPAVEQLATVGAKTGNGIWVDEHCCTSIADIYAIGDCALHANRFAADALVRIESVQNANDQAQTVARHITGDPQPYETVPWFWSNQYDLKLQTIGLAAGHDDVVVRGNPDDRSFAVVYLREGKVVALDCVNDVKDYSQGKVLVQAGAQIGKDRLSERNTPLKELAGEIIGRRFSL